jgi:hypothetical protein
LHLAECVGMICTNDEIPPSAAGQPGGGRGSGMEEVVTRTRDRRARQDFSGDGLLNPS